METDDFENFFRMVDSEMKSIQSLESLFMNSLRRGRGIRVGDWGESREGNSREYNFISTFSPSCMKCVDTVTN
jgi:hypothetical protein